MWSRKSYANTVLLEKSKSSEGPVEIVFLRTFRWRDRILEAGWLVVKLIYVEKL